MSKSTITRERIAQIANPDAWVKCSHEEVQELARMALAAMDSEPVELPLDYLHGHKDGLEWAAQLAEANHPETGDWLHDDPIELAKAIRKGPDMPPEQPVEDSEPDRNPVLAYADSYRDMAKQGVESVPIWSVITDLERNIAPLYRHAQPAPEREQLAIENFRSAIEGIGHIRRTLEETFGGLHGTHVEPDVLAECKAICDAIYAAYGRAQQPVVPEEAYSDDCPELYPSQPDSWAAGWNACRAAMLQAQSGDDGEPTEDERIMAIEGIHNCERCGDEGWVVGEMGITRCVARIIKD